MTADTVGISTQVTATGLSSQSPDSCLDESPASNLPRLAVFTTGGTIAMRKDETGGVVPAIDGAELLAAVPGIGELAQLEVNNLFNMPSDYMTEEHWLLLYQQVSSDLERDDIAGAIISHGTDTLEETAFFLDLTLSTDKPVVLVGAQRNASEQDSDGPRNLLNAVLVATAPDARGKGVMVVFNQQISAARDTSKSHTASVVGFQAGDMGFLGEVGHNDVHFYRPATRRQTLLPANLDQMVSLPKVEIVAMYSGADGCLLNAAVNSGAQGIVVQGLGAGNVNLPLFEAMKSAIAKGIAVVITTRVPNGRVAPVYGYPGGGKTLQEAGVLFAGDLSSQKARIVLKLALQKALSHGDLQEVFNRIG